ncbi:hypothetical protein GY45DRAFT_453361 [Cubamyces sp. BRFM 1775]|nr:hypothetical protein GY45DRAFT_453361 [Cubamyces sp. BRFM 1775]
MHRQLLSRSHNLPARSPLRGHVRGRSHSIYALNTNTSTSISNPDTSTSTPRSRAAAASPLRRTTDKMARSLLGLVIKHAATTTTAAASSLWTSQHARTHTQRIRTYTLYISRNYRSVDLYKAPLPQLDRLSRVRNVTYGSTISTPPSRPWAICCTYTATVNQPIHMFGNAKRHTHTLSVQ